jgi:hypothetical protein
MWLKPILKLEVPYADNPLFRLILELASTFITYGFSIKKVRLGHVISLRILCTAIFLITLLYNNVEEFIRKIS